MSEDARIQQLERELAAMTQKTHHVASFLGDENLAWAVVAASDRDSLHEHLVSFKRNTLARESEQLRAELDSLQSRYDDLHRTFERVKDAYYKDFIKWDRATQESSPSRKTRKRRQSSRASPLKQENLAPESKENSPPTPKRVKVESAGSSIEVSETVVILHDESKPAVTKTLNSLYQINPDLNNGADFQYDAVVRGREARRQLHADDCECCHEYYRAIGTRPKGLSKPMWRSPSPTKHIDPGESVETRVQVHKQQISRHRAVWERPKTPPGYWNIGFPTTQEVEQINAEAKQMHEAKLNAVRKEADRPQGRFVRR